MCGNLLHFLFQILRGKINGRSADRSATASEGTDAGRDASGVTVDRDHIVRFDAELIGHDLCKRGFLSLAVRRRAGQERDFAGAFDADSTGFPASSGQCS